MDEFVWMGFALGALAGMLHGWTLFQRQMRRAAKSGARSGKLKAAYNAIWSLVLWTLFGPYVLGVWLLGSAAYILSGLRGGSRARPA